MPSPPRRSTRSVNPPSAKAGNSSSSSSSVTSSRPERNTRASKASPVPQGEETGNNRDDASDAEDDGSDEKTRCICGQADYPGPPSIDENKSLSEESGSLFIQCDRCKVWQHGGCVGIMNDDQAPDEYFCEQCEKKDHRLHIDQKGQRYSIYLPVHPEAVVPQPASRKTSVNRSHDSTLKRDRDALSRLAAEDLHGPKRRSTMNSRQMFEEEEMLRKVIEESKGDLDSGSRKGKRGRDESEEYGRQSHTRQSALADEALHSVKPDIKRQRTGSESIDAGSTLRTGSLDAESDDDVPTTKSALKRARAAAAETQRQREMKDREKAREQAREEAAGRRQARAGRRRADEPDSDELPKPPSGKPSPTTSRPASPPEIEVTLPSSSHKKSHKKAKRLGRNQYTRDRPSPPAVKVPSGSSAPSGHGSSSSGEEKDAKLQASGGHSPASLAEATGQSGSTSANGNGSGSGNGNGSGDRGEKKGRGKHKKKAEDEKRDRDRDRDRDRKKDPIPELERQTAWMMEFVQRYQAERREPVVRSLGRFWEQARRTPAAAVERAAVTSHPSHTGHPGHPSLGRASGSEQGKDRIGRDGQGTPVSFRGVEGLMDKAEFEKLDRETKVHEMLRGLVEWRRVYARAEERDEAVVGTSQEGKEKSREAVGLGVAVEGR
ncbi:hypothetical protein CAC42_4030 [Sphaceloma murrayae]|uniref:Zinc finger PHD-type domain-containing protein n=1 Tax=Sphaceloma murrayae TaxID=2082308 RepID=A0A2K1QSQ4_9PEZI|nr:hypothetical protein CAC42_4030 [Sphaceloma murrayae]